jgi:hypothetical protein
MPIDEKISEIKSEKLRKRNKENKDYNKQKMLDEIAYSEPQGLTTNELCKIMDCTRETIRRLGNELIKEKKIIKTGRFGHYHINKEFASTNTALQGKLFRRPALSQMLELSYYKTIPRDKEKESYFESYESFNEKDFSKENKIFNVILEWASTKNNNNLDLSHPEITLEEKIKEKILNFTMKIGLLITYIMIESVKPIDKKTVNEKEKLKLAELWIKNSIDLYEIYREFQDIVKAIERTKTVKNNNMIKVYDTKENEYVLKDKDEFTKNYLIDIYQKIWPFTFEILNDNRKETIDQIEKFFDKTPKEFDQYNKMLKESVIKIQKKVEKRKKNKSKEN